MKKNLYASRPHYILNARGRSLPLGQQTRLMGIINVTTDSFSQDGSMRKSGDFIKRAVSTGRLMVNQGADILDIGGESSRPGASRISVKEEIARVIPVIRALVQTSNTLLSIDTYKPLVAKNALDAGVQIVNNIEGAKPNKSLLKMIDRYNVAIVLMHMQGTPRTMQENVNHENVIAEITAKLKNSIEICLEIGIKSDRIIVDPGIGFGKNIEHNLQIIKMLSSFHKLNCPILIGTSRKSFIGKILNKDTQDRLWGTAASVAVSILNGAHIVRVHDVAPMKDVALVTDAIINQTC